MGLELTDPGFNLTVLAEFRARVAAPGWSSLRLTRWWTG